MEGDRELLELSAKAAGLGPILCYEPARNCLRNGTRESYKLWRPLTDDGDALRLAVKLKIRIYGPGYAVTPEGRPSVQGGLSDQYENTRRAIVRAAAVIGKAMP